MSLKKALEVLGKGPCYHMQEIWGKPDMKETLSKWADAGDLSDIEAGKAALKILEDGGYNSSVDFPSSPLESAFKRFFVFLSSVKISPNVLYFVIRTQ